MKALSYNFLYLVAIVHIAGGALLPLLIQLQWVKDFFISILPASFHAETTYFWIGVFGPTVAAWGVLFYITLNLYKKLRQKIIWQAMLASILIWFVIDTVFSYGFTHIKAALWINGAAFVALLIPMLVIKKDAES